MQKHGSGTMPGSQVSETPVQKAISMVRALMDANLRVTCQPPPLYPLTTCFPAAAAEAEAAAARTRRATRAAEHRSSRRSDDPPREFSWDEYCTILTPASSITLPHALGD